MATAKPYFLDIGVITDIQDVQSRLPGLLANADFMFEQLYRDLGGLNLTAGSITGGAALTRVNDTNVTLTLGGTPTSALLQPVSLTLGWTGLLSQARGGTGIDTSGATNGQLLIGKTSDHSLNLATLIQGSNITITNGAGTITIAASGSGLSTAQMLLRTFLRA